MKAVEKELLLKEIKEIKSRLTGCEAEINNLNEVISQILEMSGAHIERREMDS